MRCQGCLAPPPRASNSYAFQATQVTISGTTPGRILEEQTLAFDWSENCCPAMQEWFYLYVCTPAGLMLHLRVLFRAQEQTRNSLLWLSQKSPQVGIQDHSTLDHALGPQGGGREERRNLFRSSSCSTLPQYIPYELPSWLNRKYQNCLPTD